MPFRPWLASHPSAEEVRDGAMYLHPTYAEVGASLEGRLPGGYHHTRSVVEIGVGEPAFSSGCEALRDWVGHAFLNIVLTPRRPPLERGVVVVAELPMGPVTVLAPCRIVATVAEPHCFGFAYGTLPGHPERGEESFVVRREADEVVRFEVTAFSRPSTLLIGLGGPVPRWIQRRATRGYLEGVRRFVAESGCVAMTPRALESPTRGRSASAIWRS